MQAGHHSLRWTLRPHPGSLSVARNHGKRWASDKKNAARRVILRLWEFYLIFYIFVWRGQSTLSKDYSVVILLLVHV